MKKGLASLSILLLVVVSIFMFSCSREQAPEPVKKADSANVDVLLKLEPDPPVALKDTVFIAEVKNSDGTPLTGADVMFDLSMPGMYHGENRPVGSETEPGVYKGRGILTMGGRWLVKVEVKAPGVDVVKEFYTEAQGG